MTDKTWQRVSDAFYRASAYIHRKGGYKAEYLTDDEVKPLIDETYNAFTEAIDYGLKDNEIPTAMRMYLQDNVFVFSGFKAHTELWQASALLRDDSGQIKPFNRFLTDIQKIDKDYNKTYLQAEYNFAVASSQAAARWQEISEGGDDFLLQYRTAKDERVREQHRILDGITLPPSDKFWDEFFPPNGWNCRCTAVQVNPRRYPESDPEEALQRGRAATFQPNAKGQNKAQIFRFNSGKQKVVFPPKHPYYPKGCGDCNLKQFKAGKGKPECSVCRILETAEIQHKTTRGKVFAEKQEKWERENNFITAVFLAEKFDWELHLKKNRANATSADVYNRTLDRYQEFKISTVGSKSSIENSIRRGSKQADYVVIRFISELSEERKKQIISYAEHLAGRYNTEDVMLIFKDFSYVSLKGKK